MTTRIAPHVWVVTVLGLLLPAIFVGAFVRAEDAPIPIDRPTVITESGSYVVTADFNAVNESAIRFDSDSDLVVTIDFAGHMVGATGAPVIMVRDGHESGCPSVSLRDGRIVVPVDGPYGTGVSSWTTKYLDCRVTVGITNMIFENARVWVEDGWLTVTSSRFVNSEMEADSNGGGAKGIFENNEVFGADIVALGTSGSLIRQNVIHGGAIVVNGSDGFQPSNDVVEENTLTEGSIVIGRGYPPGAVNIVVRRNNIAGAILLNDAYQTSIVENHVRGCSANGSGITVTGVTRLGLFDRNVVTGPCAFGIAFDGDTRYNLYRDNVLPRATCAPVFDDGVSNTDGGGNKPSRAAGKLCPPAE